jgi:hypothetical protein
MLSRENGQSRLKSGHWPVPDLFIFPYECADRRQRDVYRLPKVSNAFPTCLALAGGRSHYRRRFKDRFRRVRRDWQVRVPSIDYMTPAHVRIVKQRMNLGPGVYRPRPVSAEKGGYSSTCPRC